MIGENSHAAQIILDKLVASSDFSILEPKQAQLCGKLISSITNPNFPGAAVPNVDTTGELRIFLAATITPVWRRLSPLMRAFVGPTLSSFDGRSQPLPHGNPVADIIDQSRPAVTGIIRLASDTKMRLAALRAIDRARETLVRAPNLQRSAPVPTSLLLAQFQDYLNIGSRDHASRILGRLRSELRLDSLNLNFLEIQLLATFGDWSAIVDLPGFSDLCLARRPPAVTALLLNALYMEHLANSYEAENIDETRLRFETEVRPLAQSMLTLPAPPTLTAGGWRIFGLEAWIDPSRTEIASALVDRQGAIGWVANQFGPALLSTEDSEIAELSPLDDARESLVQVGAVESVDSLATALAALANLNSDELACLREAEPFRSVLAVAESTATHLPTSWIEWLTMAADPTFTSALHIARQGKDEWSIEAETGDPITVQALVSALNQAQGNSLAAERAGQALPFFVAWLQRDTSFPRAAMAPLYEILLTLFALGSERGHIVYESSQILVSALLSSGLESRAYGSLIADVEEIAGKGFGVNMTYWMLEIIEDFMRASTPDLSARERFIQGALSRMAPIYTRLTSLQRSVVAQLAHELGWTLQLVGINAKANNADNFASRLQGLRIAIYSLTESSSRQAKTAIEEVAPSTVVDCNADHVGTPRLRALAEHADLFVVAWRSANHAATDFIRKHRASRPLLYAQGRGFTSILRVLEDHLAVTK